jgi:hypothetical protein
MSYEGYTQLIGTCGHYWNDNDIYSYKETAENKCPACGADAAFKNAVDQTNNPCDGIIDFDKHFLFFVAEYDTCNLGHKHLTNQARYRIPTKEEAEPFREYACQNSTHSCKIEGEHKECSTV